MLAELWNGGTTKKLRVALAIGTILGMVEASLGESGDIAVFPRYAAIDSTSPYTPFAVYITASGLEVDSTYNYSVWVYGGHPSPGMISKIWYGGWKSGSYYIYFTATSSTWGKWVYLYVDKPPEPDYEYYLKYKMRKGTTEIFSDTTRSLTLLNMSTNGAWVYATAASATAGKAILAFDESDNVIGSYSIENNHVDEGYDSTKVGYFKIAVPANTSIPKLQARNTDNTVFDTQTGSWSSGGPGIETNLDAQGDVSLPILLSSFTASASEGRIVLRWRTESEVDILGFRVLRAESREGPYEDISGLIPASGGVSAPQEYSFTDTHVKEGEEHWYRLEEVGTDGKGKVLRTISQKTNQNLKESRLPTELFPARPNPFNPDVLLSFRLSQEDGRGWVHLGVYDITGKLVREWTWSSPGPGFWEVRWGSRDVRGRKVGSGTYLVQLSTENGTVLTQKIARLR